ncbi:hypothetical protein L6452_08906 [Arctium lappa]|uniref:Uncharacterized protein n=1 Tax=Arctium lappa TaxID=4217 RepID=A0ACB9DJJ8_ARCLA|nr:hypothetical protein L6452_08906 [Arctium lappa]
MKMQKFRLSSDLCIPGSFDLQDNQFGDQLNSWRNKNKGRHTVHHIHAIQEYQLDILVNVLGLRGLSSGV